MSDLLPCPMCGSLAKLDATGTAECYGHDWQTLYIECTKTEDKHCGMILSLSADFFYNRNAESVLTTAWNNLDRRQHDTT